MNNEINNKTDIIKTNNSINNNEKIKRRIVKEGFLAKKGHRRRNCKKFFYKKYINI